MMKTTGNPSLVLDEKDRRILALVQRDAKLPQAVVARRVGLSTAAVNERLKKLEHAGVIRRYIASVEPESLGSQVAAFIEVFIEHPRFEPHFIDEISRLHEVQECHHITGEFSVLLKVRAPDIVSLQRLLIQKLNSMEGVRQTRTVIVLSTSKEECYVPTGAEGDLT